MPGLSSTGLPTDTALVVTTSGSSGEPRGVILSHAALQASTRASLERLGCRPGERWVLALPVQHIAGLQVIARARALGTAPILVTDPGDPHAIGSACAAAHHVALVPTQLVRCLEAGVNLSHLRTVLVGGGPIPTTLSDRAAAAGIRMVRSYGMTELCGGCVYDGVPLDDVEVRIGSTDEARRPRLDVHDGSVGIILLRGPMRATGYLPPAASDAFLPDGWFRTDDLGSLEAGRLTVFGRRDDVIVSGGVNVPAPSVEQALRTLAGIEAEIAATDLSAVQVNDAALREELV
jgi:O-succinylbenzoic acid--CoA ligase